MPDKTVLFVGTHPDDIEIGCGGTMQVFRKHGTIPVGLIITLGHENEDVKRRAATEKSSELLGYTLEVGCMDPRELNADRVQITVKEVIERYQPVAVFGHSWKDTHHNHKTVCSGTDSAARRVRNRLHFVGPEGEHEFSPNVFFTYTEEEFKRIAEALELHRTAYDHARYFHEEYLAQKSWLGQRVLQYVQRENAPYVFHGDKQHRPYAEGFECRDLVNPILSDNIFFNSTLT